MHVVSKHGNFIITLLQEQTRDHYIMRKMTLKADPKVLSGSKKRENPDNYIREIYHWHFTTWPDHEAAEEPVELVKFVTEVRLSIKGEKQIPAPNRFTAGPLPLLGEGLIISGLEMAGGVRRGSGCSRLGF